MENFELQSVIDSKLNRESHLKYFLLCLQRLPSFLQLEDSNNLIFAFFSLSALDILNQIDQCSLTKDQIIDWIYSHQIPFYKNNLDISNELLIGFRGSNTFGHHYYQNSDNIDWSWDSSHIAMTYISLLLLLTLQDDFSRVNRSNILNSISKLQLEDGSFSCSGQIENNKSLNSHNEGDMRFVYCAVVICYILKGIEFINVEKICEFIKQSLTYEGGFSQLPMQEAHGGSTFCALASLKLLGKLEVLTEKERENVLRWCLMRQQGGFQGRTNKVQDTCYSFWVGSSISILNHFELINTSLNRSYLLSTQRNYGGFSKHPQEHYDSDPLHSYFALCSFSMMNEEGFLNIIPELNITAKASRRIDKLMF